ncbi:hypothetical protein [Burkholderia cepacia]|uniref:hypothetical protein n=1 Tax=Burkholderia cepacia TaxID=292 RepID=UPI000A884057|nr:hypothetical protein [Burkholderia cepacia]
MAASFDERNLPSYRETTAARRAGARNAGRRQPASAWTRKGGLQSRYAEPGAMLQR